MAAKIPQSVREEQIEALSNIKFIRWSDEYNNARSKAIVRCESGHDWAVSVDNLLNKRRACPRCCGKHKYSKSEREEQLKSLGGMRFVRWVSGYTNQYSRAEMICAYGHTWSASVTNLIDGKYGCPKCAKNCHRSETDRKEELNALPCKHFVRWLDGYRNAHSKAVMRCDMGHEWSATINSLVDSRTGCPTCASHGFDPLKPGTVYALMSECGAHVKVGISHEYKRRATDLRRSTPFGFSCVYVINLDDGFAVRQLEKLFHSNFESSGFSGFDGATEWLKFDPAIIELMKILGAEVPDELLSTP